jgi:DUF1680 family protein
MDVSASRPREFSVFLRIPEWATGARVTVNGTPGERKLMPATFAELRREWKSGDRIELELPLNTQLEPVDQQHPNQVALLRGPLVLMAVSTPPVHLSRTGLLSAAQSAPDSHTWSARTDSGPVLLKAFPDIGDEQYTTYMTVAS